MFIEESNTLKTSVLRLYDEVNTISEAMYFFNQHQSKVLDALLEALQSGNNIKTEEFDSPPTFYHLMKYEN